MRLWNIVLRLIARKSTAEDAERAEKNRGSTSWILCVLRGLGGKFLPVRF